MQSSAEPAAAGAAAQGAGGSARLLADRVYQFGRTYRVDIAWAVFIVLNLIAMRLIPAWQTVPFLIIWISLTAIYGFRLWHLGLHGPHGRDRDPGHRRADRLAGAARGSRTGTTWPRSRCWPRCSWSWSGTPAGGRRPMEEIEARLRAQPAAARPAAPVPPGRLARAGHAHHHRSRPRRAHHARRHRPGHRQGRPGGRGRAAPDAPAVEPAGAPGLDRQPGLPAPGPGGRRRSS